MRIYSSKGVVNQESILAKPKEISRSRRLGRHMMGSEEDGLGMQEVVMMVNVLY